MNEPLQAALYPWTEPLWQRWVRDLAQLPHALLLAGPVGLGKADFARELAQALLCAAPVASGRPCITCKSCQLARARTHPDLLWVAPPDDGEIILIDQIRAVGEFLSLRPHSADRKVAVLAAADTMNVHAANSLLKALEEPPPGSHLLLLSAAPQRLPATIRSRCVRMTFTPPPPEQALAWLKPQVPEAQTAETLFALAEQAPLRALGLAQANFLDQRAQWLADLIALAQGGDPLGCAARWKKGGTEAGLAWLQTWLADLIRLARGPAVSPATHPATHLKPGRLFNPDQRDRLQDQVKGLNLKQLFHMFELASRNRALVGTGVDELLLVEEALLFWAQINRGKQAGVRAGL